MAHSLFQLIEQLALKQDITIQKKEEASVPEIPKKKIFYNDGNSWLNADRIYITDKIYIRIPTVGEVLNQEQFYYSMVYHLTMVPYQFMVQLDDIGIDYTTINEWQLFQFIFPQLGQGNLSLIFGDTNTSDYKKDINSENKLPILSSHVNGISGNIDELVYVRIADTLRKIHNLEKVKSKPGNEEAKRYLLEKERKKMKRNAKKPYSPYLEKMVVALVNRPEFKYNYEETMNLSIYKFNQSFKQIQASITFDNTMIGVYAGTVDTSKLTDKSCLSWIPLN